MKPKVYIAGPMRGYVNFNFPAFHNAAAELAIKGYIPISPASMDILYEGWGVVPPSNFVVGHSDSVRFIRRDINVLLDFDPDRDCIYMLKGWETSKGAAVEKTLSEFLGLTVLYEGVD